jgi:AcrR family transcriptional regulator
MKRYNKDTETKILQVAETIFREKGYSGCKTQEIADRAGINKALLHYYFKSKRVLFERVFLLALEEVFQVLATYLNSDQPLIEKTPSLVASYLEYASKNVNLFVFVISEVWQNQDFTQKFVQVALEKVDFSNFFASYKREVEAGILRDINPIHYLVNLISLSIFPFLISPIMKNMLATLGISSASILKERQEIISQSLLTLITTRS